MLLLNWLHLWLVLLSLGRAYLLGRRGELHGLILGESRVPLGLRWGRRYALVSHVLRVLLLEVVSAVAGLAGGSVCRRHLVRLISSLCTRIPERILFLSNILSTAPRAERRHLRGVCFVPAWKAVHRLLARLLPVVDCADLETTGGNTIRLLMAVDARYLLNAACDDVQSLLLKFVELLLGHRGPQLAALSAQFVDV